MNNVEIQYSPPDIDSYLQLRKIAGLRERSRSAAEIGLKNSLFVVSFYSSSGKIIAMGRVVGDGGCNFEVVDIAVDPKHQSKGFGRKIMGEIMKYLQENVPKQSYVSLIANSPWLYEKFGFELCAPELQGMQLKW